MRILVLLPSLLDLVGGIQTYSQALVWALNELAEKLDWQITVLALHDRSADGPKMGLRRVTHRGFGGSKFQFGAASLKAARHQDVVILGHVHFAPLLHGIRLVSPKISGRVSAHGIEVWKRLDPLTASGLRLADEVWPVSEYTRQRMIVENPGLERMKFNRLPNTLGPAYPPAGRTLSREELKLPRAGKVVLCVSRMSVLESYKNVESIVRSMPAILQRSPDTLLVLAGPGDDRPRLEAIARELGVSERVVFTGRVSDELLQAYFAACDVFVLPSTGEGFGIVYLEAMYHAKACIGATAGGVPEVIEDGVTGLLVDAEVAPQLPDAMLKLLGNDTLRQAMGAAGKKRLEEKFSLQVFRDRLASLLGTGGTGIPGSLY